MVRGFWVQGPDRCSQQADSSPRMLSKPNFAPFPTQTCLPRCRARCGAGFSLLHRTLSQPQHSSQATWQPSRQESSQLRSQELPGCMSGAPAWWTQGPQQPLKTRVVAAALKCRPSIGEEAAAPHSCLSRAFCVALSLTRLSCAALRSGR